MIICSHAAGEVPLSTARPVHAVEQSDAAMEIANSNGETQETNSTLAATIPLGVASLAIDPPPPPPDVKTHYGLVVICLFLTMLLLLLLLLFNFYYYYIILLFLLFLC